MVRTLHHEELEAIRARALELHTRLLAEARAEYEQQHGHVANPSQLLQLVAYGTDFAWLRPLSRLIVDLDIRLERDDVSEADLVEARATIERLAKGDPNQLMPS